MPVLMVMEAPGATADQYERTNEIMGIGGDADAPEGLIEHVAAIDDGGVLIVDLWESEEALGRFFEERLGAALKEAGLGSDEKPRIMPVHNALEGGPDDAGILMLIDVEGLAPDAYDEMASKMPAHTGDTSQGPWVRHTA